MQWLTFVSYENNIVELMNLYVNGINLKNSSDTYRIVVNYENVLAVQNGMFLQSLLLEYW